MSNIRIKHYPQSVLPESRVFIRLFVSTFMATIPWLSMSQPTYVDWQATGINNGTSWTNAYTSLIDAIENASYGDVIWVREGTYYPTSDTNHYTFFELRQGVKLYGGFDGTETTINQRNWQNNETILSGDIGIPNDSSDNCLTVVFADSADTNSLIDGFTITGGNARGDILNISEARNGGGLFALECSPNVYNCKFEKNYADQFGGGLYFYWAHGDVRNCIFIDNHTTGTNGSGGGMFAANSASGVTDCDFLNNTSKYTGGLCLAYGTGGIDATPLANCRFIGNSSQYYGGGFRTETGRHVIDCYFENNYSKLGGGMYAIYGKVKMEGCTFIDNHAYNDGGALWVEEPYSPNAYKHIDIDRCRFYRNTAARGGAIFLYWYNALIQNSVFVNDTASTIGGAIFEVQAYTTSRIQNCTFLNNEAPTAKASYHYRVAPDTSAIYNCIVWGGDSNLIENQPNSSYPVKVWNSIVQGGYFNAINIVTQAPGFVDSLGQDGIGGTPDDDLHIDSLSPARNTGQNDSGQLQLSIFDLVNYPRVNEDVVDRGAYEYYDCGSMPPEIALISVNDTTLCLSDSLLLIAESLSEAFGYWSKLSGSGVMSDYLNDTNLVTNLSIGVNRYVWHAHTCGNSTFDTITITVKGGDTTVNILAGGPTIFCNGDSVMLSTPYYLSSVLWSNNQSSNDNIITLQGSYSFTAIDSVNCKIVQSNNIQVTVHPTPPTPLITASDSGTICLGDTAFLFVTGGNNAIWSTNDTSSTIIVTSGQANYYASSYSSSTGCLGDTSNSISIIFVATPPIPTIQTPQGTFFCGYDTAILAATPGYYQYHWSTADTGYQITTQMGGTVTLAVEDSNGCVSDTASIELVFIPQPSPPLVTSSSNTSFCLGDSVSLSGTGQTGAIIIWNTGDTALSLSVKSSGDFAAWQIDSNGCISERSDTLTTMVYPKPTKPTMTFSLDTAKLCLGTPLTIGVTGVYTGYQWSTGNTGSSINLSASAIRFVRVKNNYGCWSSYSDTVFLNFHSNPGKPHLIPGPGPINLCNGDSIEVTIQPESEGYLWSTGAMEQSITIYTTGTYSAIVLNEFGCKSIMSDDLHVKIPPPVPTPEFEVHPDYEVCQNDSITIQAEAGYREYEWNNETGDATYILLNSDNLMLRAMDEMGCWSAYEEISGFAFHPRPIAPIITMSPSPHCLDKNVELTALTNEQVLWSNGSSDPMISVRDAENVWAIAITDEGCESVDTGIVVIDWKHEAFFTSSLLEVFPLPFQQILYIRSTVPLFEEKLSFQLHTLDGRVIKSWSSVSLDCTYLDETLVMPALASGVYTLRIMSPEETISVPVICIWN